MDVRLTAILSAKVDAFLSGINQAASKLQKFGQDADKIGAGLSIAISAPLALLGRTSLKTAGEFDAMERGLASLEKNATTLEARLKTLTAVANLPGGLGFKEAVAGDVRLRTILNSIYGVEKAANLSVKTLRGFSNAAALVGKGQVEISRALYGVQQLANTEFPLGEDLNIIKDAIPQVSAILNEAFGTTRTQQLQKMKVSSQDVFEAILTGLEKLPQGTIGIATTFEQIQQAIDQRLAKIGKSLFKTFDIGGITDRLLSVVDSLIAKFDALSPIAQKVVVGIGAIAVVIPPIIAAIGLIAPAITAGIAVIGTLISPIGAVAVAVGVAVGAIITHWDSVKKTLVDSGAWKTLSRIAESILSGIVSIFGVFANLIQGDWGNLWVHLKNIVYSAASAIIQVVGDMMIEVISLIQKVSLIKMPSLELSKAGIRGVQDAAQSAVIPAKAPVVGGLFEGFNFFNGSNDPTKKKTGATDQEKAAAKKALEEYVKAQSDASKSIVESLQRTRDISISLIKDETERKRAELKAQAADRRAQVSVDVENETQRAKEILAINEKLSSDLLEIEKKNRTLGGIDVRQIDNKQIKNVSTPTGNNFDTIKDLQSKTSKLPAIDRVMESIESASDKIRVAKSKIEASFQGLRESFESAFSGWNVGGAIEALDKYTNAIAQKIQNMTEQQKATFIQLGQNTATVFSSLGDSIGGAFEAFGDAIVKGKNPFAAFGKAIISSFGDMLVMIGKQMLKQAAALAALAILSGGALTPVMGRTAIAGAALVTAGSALRTIPALARGGSVYGPTVALVGDNPNAHIDPEIIGPSSMMRKIVREESGGVQTVRVIGEIRNDKIVFANARGQNERNTLRGR